MRPAPLVPRPFLFALVAVPVAVAAAALRGQTPPPPGSHPPQRYTVAGLVTDSARVPLANADVGLNVAGEVVAVVRTGADGRFAFNDLLPVRAALRVRRAGYHSRTLAVDIASDSISRGVTVALTAMTPAEAAKAAASHDSLVVAAEEEESEDPGGRLRAFNERRARHRFAYFYDRQQISHENLQFTSEMLRTVPGAQIRASGRLGNTIRLRGCRPMLWVDGMRVPGAELDEIARPSDVAAIEVYPTLGAIPPQFADMPSQCGSIVVWMR
jgi:carboxypeptidase family protein/TonB-dependent receptor-like protein